ncbi:MAG: hypothetical protein ABIN18_13490 [Pseudomonadota bacterium]
MSAFSVDIISPAMSSTLGRLVPLLAGGTDAALVGPKGSGLSTILQLVSNRLKDHGVASVLMDCSSVMPWQESFRQASAEAKNTPSKNGMYVVLLVDHCNQLETNEIKELREATKSRVPVEFHACLWAGCIDCRSLETQHSVCLTTNPKEILIMHEYGRDDLLRIYSAVGKRNECEWGEAILYFIHDWCGNDLALVNGISEHFYGNWKENLYDTSVLECLDRWLNTDAVVDEYRRVLRVIQGQAQAYLGLLCSGGKILCQAPAIEHETDQTLRHLYFCGILTPNLIPGFYQFRNLTMRLLSMQHMGWPHLALGELLRKSSNNRINRLLQDLEITMRQLLVRCFMIIGNEKAKEKLQKTKTEQQAVTPELRRLLSEWADNKGGENLRTELTRHLTDFSKEFERTHNLWTRVCCLYAAEKGATLDEDTEPPLGRIVEFLTFSELSSLILGLCREAFDNWNREEPGKQPPAKRWPAYLARLGRLRNQAAHLRNVTFQDMEDLLVTAKDMRRDIREYV